MSHIMISYNWGSQDIAKKIAQILKNHNIPVWIDIDGGISTGDINVAMAEGVENAKAIVCLVSEKYEKSKNCRKELSYSDVQNKIIFPCMVDKGYNGKGWLGILTAGLLYHDFRHGNEENVGEGLAKAIADQLKLNIGEKTSPVDGEKPDEEKPELTALEIFNQNFKGRVFRYKNFARGDSSYVHFDSLDHVYLDYTDEAEKSKEWYGRYDEGEVDVDDLKIFNFKNIKILGERTFNGTIDLTPKGYFWWNGNYTAEDNITSYEFTYELSEDLKSVKVYKELFYNSKGDIAQYSVTKDGITDWSESGDDTDPSTKMKQTSSFLLDEEKSSCQEDVKAQVLKEADMNENYVLKYFEEKVLREQVEKEMLSLRKINEDLRKENAVLLKQLEVQK